MKACFEDMKAREEGHKVWKELAGAFAFAKAVWKGTGKGKGKGKCRGKGMWNPFFPFGDQFMPGMEGADSMPWWASPWRDWSYPAPDMSAADFPQWPSWGSWPAATCPGFGTASSQDAFARSGGANADGGDNDTIPTPSAPLASEVVPKPIQDPAAAKEA
jgi:hypothetical protein